MSPTLPLADAAAKVPTTKAWLLLLSLLSTLLIASHQARPVAPAPRALAARSAPAPQRLGLAHPAATEAAPVAALWGKPVRAGLRTP